MRFQRGQSPPPHHRKQVIEAHQGRASTHYGSAPGGSQICESAIEDLATIAFWPQQCRRCQRRPIKPTAIVTRVEGSGTVLVI